MSFSCASHTNHTSTSISSACPPEWFSFLISRHSVVLQTWWYHMNSLIGPRTSAALLDTHTQDLESRQCRLLLLNMLALGPAIALYFVFSIRFPSGSVNIWFRESLVPWVFGSVNLWFRGPSVPWSFCNFVLKLARFWSRDQLGSPSLIVNLTLQDQTNLQSKFCLPTKMSMFQNGSVTCWCFPIVKMTCTICWLSMSEWHFNTYFATGNYGLGSDLWDALAGGQEVQAWAGGSGWNDSQC